MLFLDDFLEMLEELPQELYDRCMEMKRLDAQVQVGLKRNREAMNEFFLNGGSLSEEERNARFQVLQMEYARIRAIAEEKLSVAERMQDLINKYMNHLEKEKTHFQLEMEADNPGVTEAIEKRYREYVEALIAMRKERKRKHTSSNASRDANLNGFGEVSKEANDKIARLLQEGSSLSRAIKTDFDDSFSSSLLPSAAPSPSPAPRGRPPKSSLMLSSALVPNNDDAMSTISTSSGRRRSNPTSAAAALKGSLSIPLGMSASSSRLSPVASEKSWSALGMEDSPTSLTPTFTIGPQTPTMPTFVGSESRHGRPRKLTTRVQEMFKDAVQRQRHHHHGQMSGPVTTPSAPEEDEEGSDGEEEGEDSRTWCFCSEKSYGDMVACDNKACPYQWFHYPCVGVKAPPIGRWYCPHCAPHEESNSNPAF